nr:unnamed protein product [Leishmania braziliensis]
MGCVRHHGAQTAKPAKRVSFGPVTYVSALLIEASEGAYPHDSRRLVDALAPHPCVSGPATVAIVAAATTPHAHNEVDGLLGMGELEEYAAQPTLLLGSSVGRPHAMLWSAQQAANVVTDDNWKGGDTQDRTAVPPERATPASSSGSRSASFDGVMYDTLVKSRPATRRYVDSAAKGQQRKDMRIVVFGFGKVGDVVAVGASSGERPRRLPEHSTEPFGCILLRYRPLEVAAARSKAQRINHARRTYRH